MANKKVTENITIYWVAATAIAIWFLFIHSPPILIQRNIFQDPLFLLHLCGAYTVYLACIHNTLLTPTMLQSKARQFHVFVGRLGMVAGVVGFIFGLLVAWLPSRGTDQGFAIGISIGGTLQMVAQTQGYQGIKTYKKLKFQIESIENNDGCMTDLEDLRDQRDKALEMHIKGMLSLFVSACTIPAMLRLVDHVPDQYSAVALTLAIMAPILCVEPYTKIFTSRIESRVEPNAVPLTQTA